MREYIEATSAALGALKIPIYGTPSRSIFRVYRDVRFTHDKRPYRTHAAAYLSRDAERGTPGGLYVQIAPKSSLLAVTFYRMDPPNLNAWRRALVDDPQRFARVLRALERAGLELGDADTEDMLARMPRGFEAQRDAPFADLLRRKSFTVRRSLSQSEFTSDALVPVSVAFVRACLPFLRFGWALADTVSENATCAADTAPEFRRQRARSMLPRRR